MAYRSAFHVPVSAPTAERRVDRTKAQAKRWFVALTVLFLVTIHFATAAFADTTLNLLPEHVGATNPGFEDESPNCGPDPQGDFLWVFALVWIDEGTPPGVLTARFEKSGVIVDSAPVLFGGGNMQRFYVYTDVPDKVLGASVVVPNEQSGDPRAPALKLSSVRQGCAPPEVLASTALQLGACTFNEESLTPATITISPPGSATVTIRDESENVVAVVSETTTKSLGAGTFSWTALAAEGFTLEGASAGTVTAHSCQPSVLPQKIKPPLATTGPSGVGILAAIGFAMVGSGALMIAAERRRSSFAAVGFGVLVALGAFAIASFPLFLLPVLLARGSWRRSSAWPATIGPAGSWRRSSFGPVIAVSRGGVWKPAFN
jgi:hypothetical protein